MVGKPSGASLEQTGRPRIHRNVRQFARRSGPPWSPAAKMMFLFPTGGKSWRSQVDVTESPTYFDSVFFLDVLSCWGEKVLKAERCWKFHSFGVAKFPFAQIYSWTCSENPLRICGTALLGTCRFAKPLLYSCGNAPAKNGLFWCWLRWVFSCRDGSGETFFITFCWLIVVQGGFLLIPLILAIWKPVFWSFTLQWFSPGLTFLVCQDHCHRWRDTRPVFMSKSAGFWTQLFSAHGKEKIRKCVFLFCATSITGQLETQQDEMWWDFLGCSEF